VGSVEWGKEIAEVYDATSAAMFEPAVLDSVVSALAGRGVPVHGIELSPHMVEQLRAKPGADAIGVTLGDMTSARVEGRFRLVYLVFNTIMNVTTQDEQVAVFANAATHLASGGVFVVEVVVPQLRRLPPTELGRVFVMEDDHVGIETFDDLAGQVTWSHHWMQVEGRLVRHSAPYRYVWPSELDLMARVAGLRLRDRWSGWGRQPFTAESPSQVVVYEKP
jgi:SAM-dependent methyltransferase